MTTPPSAGVPASAPQGGSSPSLGRPGARAGSPLITVENVNKHFGPHHVLRDVTTHFNAGEVTVIIGASGSGKSTLLRTLNRLEKHDSGRIVVDGIEVSDDHKQLDALRAEVGMVFQQFNLFPHLTVLENVTLAPRRVRKTDKAKAEVRAMELLDRVGLKAHALKHPFQLSGGQRQRVPIARALAMEPRVILFDATGMTMIVVTHEMGFARDVSDRVLFLDKGCIAADAPPQEFFGAQSNERIRAFLGQIAQH